MQLLFQFEIESIPSGYLSSLCWGSDENNNFLFSLFFVFLFQPKAPAQTLLSEVFLRGNLMESDYFGLEFQNMQMNWVRT